MAIEIVWSANALQDLEKIIEYLLKFWNKKVALEFEYKLHTKIELLALQPRSGRTSTSFDKIKSLSITKHNRLYNLMSDSNIEILGIFDTRQDPVKNIYE